uniref:Branched-chain-amino-acid aminotransferase n=1 Tax=Astyanax mexicanus TaxID=7994 RepID=A0A8B9JGZ0_ASTMX
MAYFMPLSLAFVSLLGASAKSKCVQSLFLYRNYGASIYAQYEAVDYGCQQVLWLYGDDHQITEVGTMNLFLYWINEKGEEELATPPLDGIILPGITRQSILDITRQWGEFKVSERYLTMADLRLALEEERVKEMFGSGTACVVSPVGRVLYQGENLQIPCESNCPPLVSRLLKELTDIQVSQFTYLLFYFINRY